MSRVLSYFCTSFIWSPSHTTAKSKENCQGKVKWARTHFVLIKPLVFATWTNSLAAQKTMWPQNLILVQFFSRNGHILLPSPVCKNMMLMLMTRVVFASSKLRKIFEEWRWFKARGLHSQMIGGYVRCTNFDNFQPRRNLIKIVLIGKGTFVVFDPKYSNF